MQPSEHIAHDGIVTNLVGDKAIVHVLAPDSCHSCHIKEFCGVDDEERSRFEVPASGLRIGDHVQLQISSLSGFRATFWAYILPFLLLLLVFVLVSESSGSEGLAGFLSLAVLIPYYLLLSFFKHHLKAGFQLKVSRS